MTQRTPKTQQTPTYHLRFDAETSAALQALIERSTKDGTPTTASAVIRLAVRKHLGIKSK